MLHTLSDSFTHFYGHLFLLLLRIALLLLLVLLLLALRLLLATVSLRLVHLCLGRVLFAQLSLFILLKALANTHALEGLTNTHKVWAVHAKKY